MMAAAQQQQQPPQLTFSGTELGIERRVFKALARMGMSRPMPVQTQCIPLALEGKDLLVRAATGSGKTLAYTIPLVQLLLRQQHHQQSSSAAGGCRGLVIVPSAELVEQVVSVLQQLVFYCSEELRVVGVSGGRSLAAQTAQLQRRPEIIVGTPTRLVEHLQLEHIKLSELSVLVVDEADLVLSCGYEEDMKELVRHLPRLYQAMLMSATLTPDVRKLEQLILHNAQVINDTDFTAHNNNNNNSNDGDGAQLREYFIRCPMKDKYLMVYGLLKLKMIQGKLLFFVNTNDECYRLKLFLEQFSIPSAVLNADLPFNSRQSIIEHYNRGLFDILIATDESLEHDDDDDSNDEEKGASKAKAKAKATVSSDGGGGGGDDDKDEHEEEEDEELEETVEAMVDEDDDDDDDDDDGKEEGIVLRVSTETAVGVSRGVDFQRVAAVINFNFPLTMKSYVHRVGRTARGDAQGIAVSLVSVDEAFLLKQVRMSQLSGGTVLPNEDEELAEDDPRVRLNALVAPMAQIEPFRYRVEDQLRLVSRASIREARLREVRQEMLHSEKLKSHFEDNPREYALLKHDKVLRPSKVAPHLQHVPSYLHAGTGTAPAEALTPVSTSGHIPFAKPGARKRGRPGRRRQDTDPLRTFAYKNNGSSSSGQGDGSNKKPHNPRNNTKRRRRR